MLLTRSPLSSQWKQASIEKTVRLACIRHAASVRPEPGSNSHVNVDSCTEILHVKLIALNFLLTLCLRYLVSPSFASTEIEAPCTFGSFILHSVFKGLMCCALSRDNFYIISHPLTLVNNYFKIINQLNARQLLYNTTKRPPSQCFFETFFQEHVQQLLYNTISIMRLQYLL